jgi:hypothetical protein
MSSWLRKIAALNTGLVSLVIIVIAAFAAIPKTAWAETRITGEPRELTLDAYDTTLQEVLTALSSSFGLQYRTSTDLNRNISGTYKGSRREVITQLLGGYDFFVHNSRNLVEIVVDAERSNGSRITAPRGRTVNTQRASAKRMICLAGQSAVG